MKIVPTISSCGKTSIAMDLTKRTMGFGREEYTLMLEGCGGEEKLAVFIAI
jgi:hypothetical protein